MTVRIAIRWHAGDHYFHAYGVGQFTAEGAQSEGRQFDPAGRKHYTPVCGEGLHPRLHLEEQLGQKNRPDFGNQFEDCRACIVLLQRVPHWIVVAGDLNGDTSERTKMLPRPRSCRKRPQLTQRELTCT